jgi:excisionase family DNA binding protein
LYSRTEEAKRVMKRAMETLYSVEGAAKKLGGVSKFTIYAWLSRGTLERTKVGGRTMIRESSLLDLLERGADRKSGRSARTHKPQNPSDKRQASPDGSRR